MTHTCVAADVHEPPAFENIHDLAASCTKYYASIQSSITAPEVRRRRVQLSDWVRRFHQDAGTLTPAVEEAINRLRDSACLLLMTAHQPNLFSYGGVLRKATLNHVLTQEISTTLGIPVITFFGIADQDFADDRWVRTALLPDVNRRDGVLELTLNAPRRLMLNRVRLPREVLASWRRQLHNWCKEKLASTTKSGQLFGIELTPSALSRVIENLSSFWSMIEDAYERAETYSDFNAFVMSRIVNQIWGYDTLFSRFSECQAILEDQFCFLLSHFKEYSRHVAEAEVSVEPCSRNVRESDTIPFWHHCDCGSKARLSPEWQGGSFSGRGECLLCRKEHHVDFHSSEHPRISEIANRISARAISMPLVFFNGLSVCCYTGGVAGSDYMRKAQHVARNLHMDFPPTIVWRPRDIYLGLGQLEAFMVFRELSGTYDLSKHITTTAQYDEKTSAIRREIRRLESEGKRVADSCTSKEALAQHMKSISTRKKKIIEETALPVLVRRLELLRNVESIRQLYPCIVDYATNIGLESTSNQWISFLRNGGSFSSDVVLETNIVGCAEPITTSLRENWRTWQRR